MSGSSVLGVVVGVAGLIAVLQGAAWLGPRRATPRPWRGAALSCVGLLAIVAALLLTAVPGFFG